MAMERWRPFGAVDRWEPFRNLVDIQGEVNRLFDQFFGLFQWFLVVLAPLVSAEIAAQSQQVGLRLMLALRELLAD